MKTFPINLRLAGLPVLVIGGGALAAEKLAKLLPHAPRLTLVSPVLSPATADLVTAHDVRHLPEAYRPAHLAGQRLIFVATDDPAVSRQVYADTRALPVLVNAADLPDCCDFILPAVVAGAKFTLAISTGGAAAGYARQMREQLEAVVQEEDGVLELLARIRALLKRKVARADQRRERLWQILRELEALEDS